MSSSPLTPVKAVTAMTEDMDLDLTRTPTTSQASGDDADSTAATCMRREFAKWRHPKKSIIAMQEEGSFITDDSEQEFDRVSLKFFLGQQGGNVKQQFTLYCPSSYPNYRLHEDHFFVEADSGLHVWCNALNEFLLDATDTLSLEAILNKGLSLYSSADEGGPTVSASSVSSSGQQGACGMDYDYEDDDDVDNFDDVMEEEDFEEDDDNQGAHDDDEQLEDILESDLSWELEIARRKKRWRTKESELRALKPSKNEATEEERTLHQIFHDQTGTTRHPKQVFTSAGASGILTNDLVKIMESSDTTGIEADSIDDNIFQWNVKLRRFTPDCALDKDFKMLKEKFDFDYIELQLDFSMDLYPFFPPLVKVIRPRLQGSMMLRVTTMENLKLSQWNPARDMKSVLVDIKNFLETWAQLDLQSERNDRHRYQDGAYIDIEHYLLRLALVSEIVPRANSRYVASTPEKPAPSSVSAVAAIEQEPQKPRSDEASSSQSETLAGFEHSGFAEAAAVSLVDPLDISTAPPSVLAKETSGPIPGPSSSSKANKSNSDEKSAGPVKSKNFFSFALSTSKESKKKKKKVFNTLPGKNMAKGVGYSNYLQKGWDVKSYVAAQKEKDKQIELVLGKIYSELKNHQSIQLKILLPEIEGGTTANSSDTSEADYCTSSRRGSRRKRKHSPDEVAMSTNAGPSTTGNATSSGGRESAVPGAVTPVDPLSDMFDVLEGSALIPFLESKLQANSFLEICNHPSVYRCVINIIREMCAQPGLLPLLGPLPGQAHSIQSLLLSLECQARVLLEKIGKASANGSVPKPSTSATKASADKSVSDKTTDDRLAKDFLTVSNEVTQALKTAGLLNAPNGESCSSTSTSAPASGTASASPSGTGSPSEEQERISPQPGPSGVEPSSGLGCTQNSNAAAEIYQNFMKPLQFDSFEFSMNGTKGHAFGNLFTKYPNPSSQMIFRVAQELSSLSTSLPLNFSSTIFIRSDDEKATLLKAIITGPEDTPYTGGCYQFDIYFPPKYPHIPPNVSFRTTGGGTVRFNPNLYSCGKVCLSLLGTWEGAQGEQWNETSTILQVLISIQSLILCSEPYFNEPGYERFYGTQQGETDSLRYSEDVFKNNLKIAILGQIQSPPEGFEDVVHAHFYFKRDTLINELEKMLDKYRSRDVRKQFNEVRQELMKLSPPEGYTPPSGAPAGAAAATQEQTENPSSQK